jgi:hypothetical protein
MADCLGLCDYVDDVCLGCGRDFSLVLPEEKKDGADKTAPSELQQQD